MAAEIQKTSRFQEARDFVEDEIDLTRLWAILWDSRWTVVGVTAAAMLLSAAYAFLATPIYQADTLLQVEERKSGVPGFSEISEMLGAERSSAQAQIEILRSRMVMGNVVDELKLDIVVRPAATGLRERLLGPRPGSNRIPFAGWADTERRLWVDQLTVPSWLLGREMILEVIGDGEFQLEHDGELLLKGSPNRDLRSADGEIMLRVVELDAPPGTEFILVKRPRIAAIRGLQNGINASERGRMTGILSASITDPNPRRAQHILDAIARSYLMQNIQRLAAEAERSLEFLDEQLPEIRVDLDAAEARLNEYRSQVETVDLSLETKSVLDRVVRLEARLNELQFKESEISRLYTPEHPAYRTLVEQRASLEEERERLNRQVKELPETQQEILRLTRDVELNQQIYLQLLNRAQELRILKAGTVGNVRIIDNAEVLPHPVKPKKSLILALSTLLGGMLAVGGVLVRSALRRSIESPDELEQEGIAVYASLPLSELQLKHESARGKRSRNGGSRVELLALSDPGDLTIEALRSLRTSLHFAMIEANNKVLMISGPAPLVGKSFVSANLAVVLAQIGQRVLLIDGDLRKGHLHRYFPAREEHGLSAYLSGQCALEQALQATAVEGLTFMPRGKAPPNPSELLMHSRLQDMVDALSDQYDFILIDTPPILAVTDAAIVGRQAGTSLIVTRFGVSSVKEVEHTIHRFEQNGVQIKGCILNCVERRATNYYGYYNYEYESDKG